MSYRSALLKLFWISRPLSWPNTSYPFLFGYLVSLGAAPSGIQLITLIIGTLYFVGPYNLLMYGINDVYDYESDIRNPRKGGVEGMKESRTFHPTILRAAFITNVPFIVYLLIVGDWTSRVVLTLIIFAALAYSLKGLRFKEIPVLDSITSSFHFVGPLIFALSLTHGSAHALPWVAAFFLWGMASHALGAVQDILPDKEGNIKSIATVLGARNTVRLSFLLYTGATYFAIAQGTVFWPIAVVGALYTLNCVPYLHATNETSGRTNTAWRRFLWLNYGAGAIITIWSVLYHLL